MTRITKFSGRIIFLLILLYAGAHLITLTHFPLVHSDEAWLAGLTRTMLKTGSPAATESFFNLYPRFPHALRLLYHLTQAPFILISFSLFAARLPSLLAAGLTLLLLFRLSRRLGTESAGISLLLMAVDVQFWYAAHFARQEIFMLLFLVAAILLLTVRGDRTLSSGEENRYILSAGLVLVLAAGFHPNAFIITLGAGGFYLGWLLTGQDHPGIAGRVALLVTMVFLGALIWIAASLLMSPDFFFRYLDLGAGQGVSRSLFEKLLLLPRFFSKLLRGLSGTYYTPPIGLQLILFAAAGVGSVPLLAWRVHRRRLLPLYGLAVGLVAGIVLIGKYSPPSVLLLFLPGWLFIGNLIGTLCRTQRLRLLLILILLIPLSLTTGREIREACRADYGAFRNQVALFQPDQGRVLGNLNMLFAFDEGVLLDYRELGRLDAEGLSLREYLGTQDVRIIIVTDELEIINRERPVWNQLYGNPYYWYGELMQQIEERGELIGMFSAPWYGVRLMHLVGTEPFAVRVYRLKIDS